MPTDKLAASVVAPLTSEKGSGETYQRRADIERRIGEVIAKPAKEWPALAAAEGAGRLPSEVIVYLIKVSEGLDDTNVFGLLVHTLSERIARIAAPLLRVFDCDTKDEVIDTVQKKVIDLILQSPPCAQGEYMQIAFRNAVEQRTINAKAKRKQYPLPTRRAPMHSLEGEEEEESITDQIPCERPDPEENFLAQCDRAELLRLVKVAKTAVKNPQHYEAFVLRYVHGWEAAVKDPNEPSLSKYFGVSRRQIQTWLQTAREQMRVVIGGRK